MNDAGKRLGRATASLTRGNVRLEFRSTLDGTLFALHGSNGCCTLRLRHRRLHYEVVTDARTALLEVEDVTNAADGAWHTATVAVDEGGTRLYVDGYQVFAGTVDVFCAALGTDLRLVQGSGTLEVRNLSIDESVPTAQAVLGRAHRPVALVEFAANHLDDFDTARVSPLTEGSVRVRYRVRGPGQEGTLLAASRNGVERVRLTIDQRGLTWAVRVSESTWRTFAARGDWVDGQWHDCAVTTTAGAVDLYVDGYRVGHLPGQAFFADAGDIDSVVIGQDTAGRRLWGEVQQGGIYATPLNDSQLKLLAGTDPLTTTAVFDRGLDGAASYRIPVLMTLPSGVMIAGADRRTTSANDSPNHIDFVVRRSVDGGRTWQQPITVIASPGEGGDGASVIDGCMVHDRDTNRLTVLIDHYPGGIGQPNNQQGVGLTTDGRWLLTDADGTEYHLNDQGVVHTTQGDPTPFTVMPDGTLLRNGATMGNIHDKQGLNPPKTPLIARTSFLQQVWSDDEGLTWSEPQNLNHVVKAEWMHFLGTAPGTGIQLARGEHAGRLVIPVYYEGENPKRVSAAVVYSDDHGATWRRGASPNDGRILDGTTLDSRTLTGEAASLHECTAVERRDGTLLLMMRNQHPDGRVLASTSEDGGCSWGPVTTVTEIPEIFCQPNAITLDADTDTIAFMNAAQMLPYRGNGILRISYDGGRSWPTSRTLNPGHHVYQSMALAPDGDLAVLWENEWQGLYLTRIPSTWWLATR
ncbi:sialidase family protein [Micropruina sonneratiae]|uniref:sialidase family protein n=1 Tax=Micropruina sonneratiae TaxID=2986940 RepID=UPI0022270980|nr:sialidase family protein [Micropruina sp. KQZ13P-5]MCW3156961.1 exo-alpha-sialidase [Micropruina sp. KQZ13P-5]